MTVPVVEMALATRLLVQTRAIAAAVGLPAAVLGAPVVHGGRCAYCGGIDRACVRCGNPLGDGVRV